MEHKSYKEFHCESFSSGKSKGDLYCVDITSGTETLCSNTRPNTRLRDRTTVHKCYLCLHRRDTFFCPDCIEKGNFTHSVPKNLERFADKKLKYYDIQETRNELSSRIADIVCRKKQYLELKHKVTCYTEQISLLQQGIEEVRDKKTKDAERVEQLRKEILDLRVQVERSQNRLLKIQKFNYSCQESVARKRADFSEFSRSLQATRREHVTMLTTHIFPICKIEHNGSSGEETLESSESSSSNDSYLLVPFQNREESHYRILESVLPTSGDYSQYHEWLSNRKDTESLPGSSSSTTSSSVHVRSFSGSCRQLQGPPESLRNTAYCISSALSHAAQLVAALAYILDVRLPKSICYSEFCGNELTRDQFAFKVGKLNANVVYLCLSQGLESSLIESPKGTLKNLSLLLHLMPPQLGRCTPISVESHSLLESWPYGGEDEFTDLSLEDLIEKESLSGASSGRQDWLQEEEEDDWESVSESLPTDPFICAVPTRGSSSGTTSVQSQSQARSVLTQTTDTIGGGLISSVASLWRAAVGGQK